MKRETLSNIPWLLGRWSGCACAMWQIGGEMICVRMSQTTMYNKIRPPTLAKDSNACHRQATATAASHSRPRCPLPCPVFWKHIAVYWTYNPTLRPRSRLARVARVPLRLPRAGTLVSFPASLHADNYN
jgi:hypothetical protein